MLSTGLNIIILPDEKVKQTSIELSRKLTSKYDTYFSLDGARYHPHITIYQLQFPDKNFDKLNTLIREIASATKPITVQLGAIIHCAEYPNNGFVSWNCEYNHNLIDLQRRVLEIANSLREGLVTAGIGALDRSKLTPDEIHSIDTNGSLLPNLLFPFHITIGRIRDSKEKTKEIMPRREMSFLAEKIFIGKLSEHGIVSEILEEYSFI